MIQSVNELRLLIIEKNKTLDNLCCSSSVNQQKIEKEKIELDRLLYQFYKVFKTSVY